MLTYPFAEGPETGQAITIAPGVQWLRIPVPGSLQFINVWALDDGDGQVALVDTGIGYAGSEEAWRLAFAGPLAGKRASRVLVTHMHPDHIGMAGMLTREHHCQLWITRLEFLTCRALAADTGHEPPADALRFYRAAGWDEAMLDGYRARFGFFGEALHGLPDSYVRLRDGQVLRIGAHDWEVVVGSGHSPEHACLYCAELGLLISGDQVLPRISSNVGVFPMEPGADPLEDWLGSLAGLRARIPDTVLVLPAHNDPFRGLHARLDSLAQGHAEGLDALLAHLAAPARVVDCFPALFRREITGGNRLLATGECLAHLNHLLHRGRITRTTDAEGVNWYARA